MRILVLVLVAAAGAFGADPLVVRDAAVAADEQALLDQADINWELTANLAADLNGQLDDAAAALAALYTAPDDAQLVAALTEPHCAVAPFPDYLANETLIYDVLCCHARKVRGPALAQLLTQLVTVFHGTPADLLGERGEDALQNIQLFYENDFVFLAARECKDDVRIHIPETFLLRAIAVDRILGQLHRAYTLAHDKALSLASCLAQPLVDTGCTANTPTTLAAAAPNTLFAPRDAHYLGICGAAPLAALESARLTVGC